MADPVKDRTNIPKNRRVIILTSAMNISTKPSNPGVENRVRSQFMLILVKTEGKTEKTGTDHVFKKL
jgi:hypothetical protein